MPITKIKSAILSLSKEGEFISEEHRNVRNSPREWSSKPPRRSRPGSLAQLVRSLSVRIRFPSGRGAQSERARMQVVSLRVKHGIGSHIVYSRVVFFATDTRSSDFVRFAHPHPTFVKVFRLRLGNLSQLSLAHVTVRFVAAARCPPGN